MKLCTQCHPAGKKPSVLDALCQKHYDDLEGPSEEDVQRSIEEGRKARQEAERYGGVRVGGRWFYR